MKKEILFYPDPFLRKKSKSIEVITPEIREKVYFMAKVMKKHDGIGLAAPQVGFEENIIVIGTDNGFFPLLNAKIIEKSKEKEKDVEGCLSFPGLFLEIKRHKKVRVSFKDLAGKEQIIEAKGLLARVLQHEIDHTQGILFIDRVSFWQKLKLKKTLKEKIKEWSG